MSLYTLVFIFVTLLVLIGLGLFGLFISKLDKWIDKRERLGNVEKWRKPAKKKKEESD